MAHVVFATRGIKHERNRFIMFLQSQMFWWKRKNLKTGQDEVCRVQGALRPIELWEYVVPEECLDEVLTMLNVDEKGEVHPVTAKLNRWGLRKMLGLEPVKYTRVATDKFVPRDGVALYPIGIKRDVKGIWKDPVTKEDLYEQEML